MAHEAHVSPRGVNVMLANAARLGNISLCNLAYDWKANFRTLKPIKNASYHGHVDVCCLIHGWLLKDGTLKEQNRMADCMLTFAANTTISELAKKMGRNQKQSRKIYIPET
jgi:hypothetical protein